MSAGRDPWAPTSCAPPHAAFLPFAPVFLPCLPPSAFLWGSPASSLPPQSLPSPDLLCCLVPLGTANLFLLISSILGSRTAGPHTQFVQWFMEECVDCLEQDSRGSILQFMPFTTVSDPGGCRGDPQRREGVFLLGCHTQELPVFICLRQVSELVKVSAMSSPKVVLAITDLSLPLGRQVAAKAIAAL